MKVLHFLATSHSQTYPRRRVETSPGGSGQVRSTAKLRISLQILNRIENLSILTPFGSVSGRGGRSSPPSDRTSLPISPFLTIGMCAALAGCAPAPPPPAGLATAAMIEAAERAPVDPFSKANEWNEPMEPFTVIGNIHYVGTKAVSAWLITSPKGHFLIDGVVAQSAPQIAANIETLGSRSLRSCRRSGGPETAQRGDDGGKCCGQTLP
jgi:hypothetical protein